MHNKIFYSKQNKIKLPTHYNIYDSSVSGNKMGGVRTNKNWRIYNLLQYKGEQPPL